MILDHWFQIVIHDGNFSNTTGVGDVAKNVCHGHNRFLHSTTSAGHQDHHVKVRCDEPWDLVDDGAGISYQEAGLRAQGTAIEGHLKHMWAERI